MNKFIFTERDYAKLVVKILRAEREAREKMEFKESIEKSMLTNMLNPKADGKRGLTLSPYLNKKDIASDDFYKRYISQKFKKDSGFFDAMFQVPNKSL